MLFSVELPIVLLYKPEESLYGQETTIDCGENKVLQRMAVLRKKAESLPEGLLAVNEVLVTTFVVHEFTVFPSDVL